MSVMAIAVLLAAAAAGALSAAADGALLAVSEEEAEGDKRLAQLYAARESVHRTLSLARVVSHLTAGAAAALALGLDRGGTTGRWLALAAAALAVVALAENVARSVGDAVGTPLLLRLCPAVRSLELLLAPGVMVGTHLDRALHRALPTPPPRDEDREAAEEQFREVIAAEAEVSRAEEAIIQGVFSLGDTPVRDVMVPRVDIVGIEQDAPWNEVIDRMRSSEHARFPVYAETLDDILGVLYAKDLLPAVVADDEPDGGWLGLVRPATFIPGTKTIADQLRDFKASGNHLVIVADEYGGTAGLVTIEDILEEIVGEIRDEYDVEEPDLEQEEGRRYWVSGRLTVDALSEALEYEFPHEGISTVGGLVYSHLGRVPRAGESFSLNGFRVVVERVVRRKVARVYFERVAAPVRGDEG
jgi:CBS domain containing-hemolysin-like protein